MLAHKKFIPTQLQKLFLALIFSLAPLISFGSGQENTTGTPQSLPSMGADLSQTSVSGLSSGAFMTSQVYLANSDIMVGAGIIAGGPYYCSASWSFSTLVTNATTACMNPPTPSTGPNTPVLISKAKEFAQQGLIDNLDNLKDDHLYIFSGLSDEVVTQDVVDQTKAFYLGVGVPEDNITYVNNINAGHAIITDNNDDTACNKTKSPYINDCDFEQADAILNKLYENLKPPSETLSGEIVSFSQKEFITSSNTSMSDEGYLYVPAACNSKACRLHVVLHGCEQGAKVIGDEYYASTGYNALADSNDFLVLYPQVQPSTINPVNPNGCWDFWGYSSPNDPTPDFYSKNAPQIKAISAMIQRLGESAPESHVTSNQ